MDKKYRINTIVNEIDQEIIDSSPVDDKGVSGKTIERRLKDFIYNNNVKAEDLKSGSGRVTFNKDESVFLKTLIKESIDKKSFAYKFVKGEKNSASFNEIADFMYNMDQKMLSVLEDDERLEFLTYLDQSLGYSVLVELKQIYSIIESISHNIKDRLYTYQLQSLMELRGVLERQFTNEVVHSVKHITDIAEMHELIKDIVDDDINIYDVGSFSVSEEYAERDREVLKYLEENPLVKQHIEEKLGKDINSMFRSK
ncbi:hypothetical protein [Neobacillus drentensis]|uniref:hypothetical protein n=1 Tax=Neobacillus drentensis TaxID=220684 RepID=UPI002FFF9294